MFPTSAFPGIPRDYSPRLRALHNAQLIVVYFTLLATFLTAVIPQNHKAFTFSLLSTLILSSPSTTFLLRKEQLAAQAGLLSKQKYTIYQISKLGAAIGCSIVGFVLAGVIVANGDEELGNGQAGLVINGYRVNKWQGAIIWLSVFNWLFLWASLFYACCMTARKTGSGPIALDGDEGNIGIKDDDEDDEN